MTVMTRRFRGFGAVIGHADTRAIHACISFMHAFIRALAHSRARVDGRSVAPR